MLARSQSLLQYYYGYNLSNGQQQSESNEHHQADNSHDAGGVEVEQPEEPEHEKPDARSDSGNAPSEPPSASASSVSSPTSTKSETGTPTPSSVTVSLTSTHSPVGSNSTTYSSSSSSVSSSSQRTSSVKPSSSSHSISSGGDSGSSPTLGATFWSSQLKPIKPASSVLLHVTPKQSGAPKKWRPKSRTPLVKPSSVPAYSSSSSTRKDKSLLRKPPQQHQQQLARASAPVPHYHHPAAPVHIHPISQPMYFQSAPMPVAVAPVPMNFTFPHSPKLFMPHLTAPAPAGWEAKRQDVQQQQRPSVLPLPSWYRRQIDSVRFRLPRGLLRWMARSLQFR